ncbi:uncharacterized protein LOC117122565 isoform X3 [Anneissia japonica]|uniref:uncharacterized protein LOC117122565 isoform X3 n=1 Tax=Anneissia japonica TaxID=1529436 RepID=UPI0014255B8A|nr:uncharacterized protein LOC117122565 isoform X3 [Anneissia japonica]
MAVEGSSYMSAAYRYHEGFLEKRGPKDKDFVKLWTVLRQSTLYFYTNKVTNFNRDSTPVDTADLDFDYQPQIEKDRSCFKFFVKCNKNTKYKFRATSSEDRDTWIVKIFAVTMGKVPEHICLLPGQIQDVNEIIAAEKQRRNRGSFSPQCPSTPSSSRQGAAPKIPASERPNLLCNDPYFFFPPHLQKAYTGKGPSWFFNKLSRDHAEQILNKNTHVGDLLIRESETHPGEFSLSVRQESQGKIVVRHYRFRRQGDAYKMHIDDEHAPLPTMYDLIKFFVEKSGGNLKPMQTNDFRQLKLPHSLYEEGLSIAYPKDPENGERSPLDSSPDDYLPPMIHQGSIAGHQSEFPNVIRGIPQHVGYYNVPEAQLPFDDVPNHPPPPTPTRRQTVSTTGPVRRPEVPPPRGRRQSEPANKPNMMTSLTRSATRPATSHHQTLRTGLSHFNSWHGGQAPCTTVDTMHDFSRISISDTQGRATVNNVGAPPTPPANTTDDNYLEMVTPSSLKS